MMTNEPVMGGAVMLGVVQAVIALLIAFGVGLTKGQVASIEGVFTAASLAVAWLVRQHVTPTHGPPVPGEQPPGH